MSVLGKVLQTVAQVIPDAKPDLLATSHPFVGKSFNRLDGLAKVTGQAKFTAEYKFPGLVFAALVFSTIAKGRIEEIDTTEAESSAGVQRVLTHKNAPRMKEPPLFDSAGGPDDAGSTVHVLNTDRIAWNGQPVAIVVAATQEQAEHAASLVRVTYEEEPALLSFAEGKANAKMPKIVMGDDAEVKHGDAEATLADGRFKVDHEYTTPRHNQNAMELHATTAMWNGKKQLTVFDTTQFVAGVANSLAKIFSLKVEQVRVIAPFVGGGFGGKVAMWSHVQLCALAAKVCKAPVRLVLSRKAVFQIVGGRTPSAQRVALGADETGKLQALIHTGYTALTPYNDFPEQFTFPARHLYEMKDYLIRQLTVELDTVANTFMRAPGESIGGFALESAMDELSYEMGLDPIELRLRNEPERDPVKGTAFSSRHLREAFALGAEKFGWADRPPKPCSMVDGEWLVGQGVATAYYPCIRLPTAARVTIFADGTALVESSAHEMGMGTATAQTQIAAERFGLPMEAVRFEYGDSSLPKSNQAGGSSQTISIAVAVHEAFDKVTSKLLKLAAKHKDSCLRKAKPEEVCARAGGLMLKSQPDAGESYAMILTRAGKECIQAEATGGMPIEMMKYSMQSFGAQFCEVRVNKYTSEVRVSRWVGAFDCGRIVNPKTSHSQFQGGIVMGIGAALTEESLFDERSGSICNASMAEYHVPVNADIPNIETYYLDIPDPITALGAHGVGEIGITGVAAAVANAVYHATGKRVRDLPITLDKLM